MIWGKRLPCTLNTCSVSEFTEAFRIDSFWFFWGCGGPVQAGGLGGVQGYQRCSQRCSQRQVLVRSRFLHLHQPAFSFTLTDNSTTGLPFRVSLASCVCWRTYMLDPCVQMFACTSGRYAPLKELDRFTVLSMSMPEESCCNSDCQCCLNVHIVYLTIVIDAFGAEVLSLVLDSIFPPYLQVIYSSSRSLGRNGQD